MNKQVQRYAAAFNLNTKLGVIRITFNNNPNIDLKDLDPETYSAILNTLKHSPVFVDEHRWLKTDFEVPTE